MGMTTNEAIEAIKCNWPDSRYTILREALDMAVKALEDVPDKDVGKNEPLTLDDAIAHLDDTLSDTGHKWSCESCRMEHVQLRAWLAELREIKQERNTPLTIDELRKMDGEPVWIEDVGEYKWHGSGWAIVDRENCLVRKASNGNPAFFERYWEEWVAYRQKPEDGTV